MTDSVALEFTGERYTPEIGGDIACEHMHRYALCLEAAEGKRVLDIASGEGYGSRLLAERAKHVYGVDIAKDAIKHARDRYINCRNLEFLVGSAAKIPLSDESVDLVVSFETLEHLIEQEEMLAEIDRVLTKNGRLIISTPDRYVYSEKTGYSNPYHVRELNTEEFVGFLETRFKRCAFYRQRMIGASYVWPFEMKKGDVVASWASAETGYVQTPPELENPVYNIASCAKGVAKPAQLKSSLYQHVESDAWQQMLAYMNESVRLGRENARLRSRISDLEAALLSSSNHATINDSILPLVRENTMEALLKKGVSMTLSSPRLNLDYMAPAQSAKHVTVNESFRQLDALVQILVLSRETDMQPTAPSDGDAYIVTASSSGEAWSNYDAGDIAVFADSSWRAIAPGLGWIAFDAAQDVMCIFDGEGWVPLGPEHLKLGSSATYDVGVGGDTVPLQSGSALISGEWEFGTAPVVRAEPGYGLRHEDFEWRMSLSEASGSFYLHDVAAGVFPFFVQGGAPNETFTILADGSLAARKNPITTPDGDIRIRSMSRADLLQQTAPSGTLILVVDAPNGETIAVSKGSTWHWFNGDLVV